MKYTYETVVKGIKRCKESGKYVVQVNATIEPHRYTNCYIGTFDQMEQAMSAHEAAERLKDVYCGDQLMNALRHMRDSLNSRKINYCCKAKIKKEWHFCPFCGKAV